MRRYVIVELVSGEITRTSLCAAAPDLDVGHVVIQDDVAGPATHCMLGDRLVAYLPSQAAAKASRPGYWSVWANHAMAWVDPRPDAERIAALATEVRAARAARLAGCDWTQLLDAGQRLGADGAQQWGLYRQALCDITAQPGFPGRVVWPVAPGA